MIVDALRRQPASFSTLGALRVAFRAAFELLSPEEQTEQRERAHLVLSVPELRAAMLDQLGSSMGLLVKVIAEQLRRTADDAPAVRTLAGAVVGAIMAAMFAIIDDPQADFATMVDEVIGRLEEGLAL